jgi:CRP/FNR family transcriptional regulator, cyclic AMP receptor protein
MQVTSGNAQDLGAIGAAFGCGEALARTIDSLGRGAALARGQVLYPLQGREETSLLIAGQAQEAAYGREGGMLVLHLFGPGEFYGSLVGHSEGQAQVEALSEGRALHYQGEAVLRLMESYACVAMAITRQLSQRLAAMRQRMVETNLLSATGRICAELERLAKQSGDGVIRPLPVFAELAQRVQSTRETVSRTVSQLERRGVLKRQDGGLAVIAPHRLEELIY